MKTLTKLVAYLKERRVLSKKHIIQAFLNIDRKDFVLMDLRSLAYIDEPLSIGHGQTISQPYTVALMLELLNAKKGDKVLDVGSGSGYTTALLAEIVGKTGKVIGVEIIPELVTMGRNNLAKYNFSNAEIRQAGEVVGAPENSPYDRILVSASSDEIPKVLVKQLKKNGTMVIPVGNDIYKIKKKSDGSLKLERHEGFSFVPLTEKQ